MSGIFANINLDEALVAGGGNAGTSLSTCSADQTSLEASSKHSEIPENLTMGDLYEHLNSSNKESQSLVNAESLLTEEEKLWVENMCRQVRFVVFGKKPALFYDRPPSIAADIVLRAQVRIIEQTMKSEKEILDSKRDIALSETSFPFMNSETVQFQAVKDFALWKDCIRNGLLLGPVSFCYI
jgi:hypothetical protein